MKKSIKHAIYSGLIMPGMGQWKNGDRIKAYLFFLLVAVIVAGFTYSIIVLMSGYFKALANIEMVMDTTSLIRNQLFGIMKAFIYWGGAGFIVWAASGIDAYLVAKRIWGDKEE